MNNYYEHILLQVKRLVYLLILYTISRLFFYLLNTGYFSDLSFWALVKAFTAGIRFDLSTVAFINLVFFMLAALPGSFKNNRTYQKTIDIVFFSINAIAILFNFIDARYFDFINKRSTVSVFTLFGTNEDVWLLIPQFIRDYWYVPVSFAVIMTPSWFLMPRLNFNKLNRETLTWKNAAFQTVLFACVFGLVVLAGRGTALKPIGFNDAAKYADLKNVPLVINTPFSLIKTLGNQNLREEKYFSHDSLVKIYNPVHLYPDQAGFKKMNVVIFILESFSREYVGFFNHGNGYTPCLDSILQQSLVCSNAFANGRQSNEGMPAIIASIPTLLNEPYLGSSYSANLIRGLPYLLNEEGYNTSFFHGGNNGTMGFDNFARIAGVEKYYGRKEYNNDADFDGHWGIWDEPYLQYFANQLNTFKQPFFASVFTLSSHHPYKVPEKYKNKFKGGRLPILKSLQYADYALGQFFKTASKMPWYKNTLFVFSADHAAQAYEAFYNSSVGMYAIPIAFFAPGDTTLHGIMSETAQQIDIMPTVLYYLHYHKPFFAFGENLFDHKTPHFSTAFINGAYQLIEGDYILIFNGQKVLSFYNWKENPTGKDFNFDTLNKNEKEIYNRMLNRIKAVVQTYNHCLIANSLTVK